jgi:hypothetical protein
MRGELVIAGSSLLVCDVGSNTGIRNEVPVFKNLREGNALGG